MRIVSKYSGECDSVSPDVETLTDAVSLGSALHYNDIQLIDIKNSFNE